MLVRIYDYAVMQSHLLPQLHKSIMVNLKFPSDMCLSSLGLMNADIESLRDRIAYGYTKVVYPLEAYAKEYDRFIEFYTLDVDEYIE